MDIKGNTVIAEKTQDLQTITWPFKFVLCKNNGSLKQVQESLHIFVLLWHFSTNTA